MSLASVDTTELLADRDYYAAKVARHRGRGSVIEAGHLESLQQITNELGRRAWAATTERNDHVATGES